MDPMYLFNLFLPLASTGGLVAVIHSWMHASKGITIWVGFCAGLIWLVTYVHFTALFLMGGH